MLAIPVACCASTANNSVINRDDTCAIHNDVSIFYYIVKLTHKASFHPPSPWLLLFLWAVRIICSTRWVFAAVFPPFLPSGGSPKQRYRILCFSSLYPTTSDFETPSNFLFLKIEEELCFCIHTHQ